MWQVTLRPSASLLVGTSVRSPADILRMTLCRWWRAGWLTLGGGVRVRGRGGHVSGVPHGGAAAARARRRRAR
eukprot:7031250-Pyramimonas_sp.AAC.1